MTWQDKSDRIGRTLREASNRVEQAVLERTADPGGWEKALLTFHKVRYLGSHPRVPREQEKLDFSFFAEGVALAVPRHPGIRLVWSDLKSCEVLTQDQLNERVTVTRVALLGALALVAKKSTTHSFVELEDAKGLWVVAVPGRSAIELSAKLRPILTRYAPSHDSDDPMSSPPPPTDAPTRLERLASLREQGLITPEEHDSKRTEIIAEL